MNKKIVVLIAVIILVIIIITSLFFLFDGKTPVKTCKELNYETKNYILAIKNQDITYCGNTGNPTFCKAHVMKDTSFCDTHEDKNYCLAIITSNPDFCESDDFWCKADASGDPKHCSGLPEIERAPCIAETELNTEYYNKESC